ncbi:MAG: hypothetical protein PHC61_03760 [Chitinivibrionales bacterium]|nr:hypothetical protein [Chitinivibrionales bacterium]
MMTPNQPELSQEIYHRIYRLFKKNTDAKLIATAVNLPIKMVQNIVSRFAHTHPPSAARETVAISYLDILVMARGRYAVIELSGSMTADQHEVMEREFAKILQLSYKALALRMTDTAALDEKGISALLAFADQCRQKGIYVAILDPGLSVEPVICESELDAKLPVFGTETVFEKNAFTTVSERHKKK